MPYRVNSNRDIACARADRSGSALTTQRGDERHDLGRVGPVGDPEEELAAARAAPHLDPPRVRVVPDTLDGYAFRSSTKYEHSVGEPTAVMQLWR